MWKTGSVCCQAGVQGVAFSEHKSANFLAEVLICLPQIVIRVKHFLTLDRMTKPLILFILNVLAKQEEAVDWYVRSFSGQIYIW